MYSGFTKKTAVFAAVILCIALLCGCSGYGAVPASAQERQSVPAAIPSAPPPAEPADSASSDDTEDAPRRTVSFDKMQYERPDAENVIRRIEEISSNINNTEDFSSLEDELHEAVGLYYHFSSMSALASLHSGMDKSDAYWNGEREYTTRNLAGIEMSYRKLYRALYASPFRGEVEQNWGDDYFDNIEEIDYVTEKTKPFYEHIADLLNQYSEKLSTASIEYNGKEYTYNDILQLDSYGELKEALVVWYETYNPQLGGIYVELVKTRQKIAKELGFDNYTALAFSGKNTEYSSDMAQTLLDDIVRNAVPVFRQLYTERSGYNPSVYASYEDYTAFTRDVLNRLSPDLLASFDAMEYYGLIDAEKSTYKEHGAYTTYISDYDAPFILMEYAGDSSSMNTLIHEFGHFNEYYTNGDDFYSSTDTAEIFSQALELLFSNYYSLQFGSDDGYQLCYNNISDAFSSIVEQAFYTAVEMRVYSLDPDTLTVDAINEIAEEESARFSLDIFLFDEYNRYDWAAVPHIYESPFYTFAYVTSSDVALQIWELSLSDEKKAVATYQSLLDHEEDIPFIDNIKNAGLQNPFAPGRMRDLAALAKKYLIREDWSPAGQEAA